MPRVHFVKKARKDNPAVKAGESYYHWKFRYGGRVYSKVRPNRSQLTQSSFLSTYYELEDGMEERVNAAQSIEELESTIEEIASEIESLMEETQESLDNMPEHLQDSSPSGELLQERIDGLENWQSELENVDLQDNEGEEDFLDNLKEEVLSLSPGL